MQGHMTFGQFTLKAKRRFRAIFDKFSQTFDLRRSMFYLYTPAPIGPVLSSVLTLNFVRSTPDYNQFIPDSERTRVQSLKEISQSVFEIRRPQERQHGGA